jgi:hypothetical protein
MHFVDFLKEDVYDEEGNLESLAEKVYESITDMKKL